MDDSTGVTCPACGATGAGGAGFCSWCGLELTGADAQELHELVARLAARDRELSAASDRRQAAATELMQRRWALRPAPAWAGAPASPPGASPWERPRREWSVERVRDSLLWLGAALLALSALTFTAVAWSHLDDNGRAALLGATTVVITGFAVALRRRLPATADAFAGLAITVALIDWYALRRAGAGAGVSASAWWAGGTAVVAAFAFALARNGATRPARLAVGVLASVSALFAIDTFAGAAWSASASLSLVATGLVVAAQLVTRDGRESSALRALLATEAAVVWLLALGAAVVATSEIGAFASAVTPGAAVAMLGLAPVLVVVRGRDLEASVQALLGAVGLGAVLGAILTVSSVALGPEGLLVLSAALGAATLSGSPFLATRWRAGGTLAAFVALAAGLVWIFGSAVVAIAGPLVWLQHAWTGHLGTTAGRVVTGPRSPDTFTFTWTMVGVALTGLIASAVFALQSGRRRPRASLEPALLAATGLGLVAVAFVPLAAGASVLYACVTAVVAATAVLVASAAVGRVNVGLGERLAVLSIIAELPAVGWAAVSPSTSLASLSAAVVAAVVAIALGRAERLRGLHGFVAGGAASTLAGVIVAAAHGAPATAGFAATTTAGVIIVVGALARADRPDGIGLEVAGAAALVGGLAFAAESTVWFAGALTAAVPLLALAAQRRERTVLYQMAAGGAALAATWAWLAAAGVTVVEAYTAPAAVLALVAGIRAWRPGPGRSWVALGAPIAIGLGPTVAIAIGQNDTARAIAATAVAFAILILGARWRLQAPIALASAALVALAIDTLGPAAVHLPRWVPLAIAGVLVMWVGATFERRREDIRRRTRVLLGLG